MLLDLRSMEIESQRIGGAATAAHHHLHSSLGSGSTTAADEQTTLALAYQLSSVLRLATKAAAEGVNEESCQNGALAHRDDCGMVLPGEGSSSSACSAAEALEDDVISGAGSGEDPEGSESEMSKLRRRSLNTTVCVPVPSSEHVAEIVGRQGCKIKALRAKTNTYIKTPVRGEEAMFVITGRQEDVESARKEIVSAAEHFTQIRASRRHSQGGLPAPGQVTIHVRVPYKVVGLVVGPKGATIKRIQQQTHTYIITPSREKEPVFEVTGVPENVDAARHEIEAHIIARTGSLSSDYYYPSLDCANPAEVIGGGCYGINSGEGLASCGAGVGYPAGYAAAYLGGTTHYHPNGLIVGGQNGASMVGALGVATSATCCTPSLLCVGGPGSDDGFSGSSTGSISGVTGCSGATQCNAHLAHSHRTFNPQPFSGHNLDDSSNLLTAPYHSQPQPYVNPYFSASYHHQQQHSSFQHGLPASGGCSRYVGNLALGGMGAESTAAAIYASYSAGTDYGNEVQGEYLSQPAVGSADVNWYTGASLTQVDHYAAAHAKQYHLTGLSSGHTQSISIPNTCQPSNTPMTNSDGSGSAATYCLLEGTVNALKSAGSSSSLATYPTSSTLSQGTFSLAQSGEYGFGRSYGAESGVEMGGSVLGRGQRGCGSSTASSTGGGSGAVSEHDEGISLSADSSYDPLTAHGLLSSIWSDIENPMEMPGGDSNSCKRDNDLLDVGGWGSVGSNHLMARRISSAPLGVLQPQVSPSGRSSAPMFGSGGHYSVSGNSNLIQCHVCNRESPSAALAPCGHRQFCFTCATRLCQMPKPVCPICQGEITQAVKLAALASPAAPNAAVASLHH